MKPPVPLKYKRKEQGVMLFGVELTDAREELFVVMVCDGLPMGLAFRRAGFESKDTAAPYNLFHVPRVQERARAILEARRTTGVVSLAEVTDMLKRVYAGANSAEEYSAAHNAAFSLARLYGHVTDRATLEVVRRPSRDPDAPSEQALGDWVASLPVIGASGPEPSPQIAEQGQISALGGAPAPPLGPGSGPGSEARDRGPEPQGPRDNSNEINDLASSARQRAELADVHINPNEINDLASSARQRAEPRTEGRSENGAPPMAVTGTPYDCAHSDVLDWDKGPGWGPGPAEKGAPLSDRQVPGTVGGPSDTEGIPSYEDLFG